MWGAYYAAILMAIVFGSLQSAQDSMDDPFDGIGDDDIDLYNMANWSQWTLAQQGCAVITGETQKNFISAIGGL